MDDPFSWLQSMRQSSQDSTSQLKQNCHILLRCVMCFTASIPSTSTSTASAPFAFASFHHDLYILSSKMIYETSPSSLTPHGSSRMRHSVAWIALPYITLNHITLNCIAISLCWCLIFFYQTNFFIVYISIQISNKIT